jgi:hypothetical protein
MARSFALPITDRSHPVKFADTFNLLRRHMLIIEPYLFTCAPRRYPQLVVGRNAKVNILIDDVDHVPFVRRSMIVGRLLKREHPIYPGRDFVFWVQILKWYPSTPLG